MNEEQIWNKFLEKIKEKVTPISYDTWFKDTYLNKIEENKVIAVVPMPFHKKHLYENYREMITETFNEITGTNFDFEFLLEDEVKDNNKKIETDSSSTYNNPEQANLNPTYTFENYVVGESNKFAYTAAMAVAENPGKEYNPFFIFGSSGLGKTHLMHAIGNFIVKHSNKKVLYVTSEKFKDDFRDIYRKNKDNTNYDNVDYFKNKYRNIDVLIVDDIQFLANATQSQQEFFNTFNELQQNGKHIIISSDKSPNDLNLIEDRLITRFNQGLTVNIDPPDYNLRMEILKKKLSVHELAVPIDQDVLGFIANNCTGDVRKLEGALNRLFAYKIMFNNIEKIDLEFAMEALKGHLNTYSYVKNNIQKIQSVVADYYKISVDDIKSKKKTNNIAFPRQIAMYLSRNLTNESLTRIGIEFGGKDHTTIMHGCEKIDIEIKKDKHLEEVINKLKQKLQ